MAIIRSKFLWPLATLIVFIAGVLESYLGSDVGDAAQNVRLEISPIGWTFSIWGIIYLWQLVWLSFVLYVSCKYEMDIVIFGKCFYISYIINQIFSFIWTFLWTNGYIVWSALALLGITFPLLVCAYIAHDYMHRVASTVVTANTNYGASTANDSTELMEKMESPPYRLVPEWLTNSTIIKPLIYLLVLNGITFYATWCVVASHLNAGIALCYKAGMTNTNTSILMLCILSCVILVYWFLDFYYLRSYLRYTYSPYVVLMWAFNGILSNGGLDVEERPSSPFVLALLVVAGLGTIAKIIMGICMRNTGNKQVETMEKV